MKQASNDALIRLGILPLSHPSWEKFSICLHSHSSATDYSNVKKKILKCAPKGTGGVYLIAKDKKVLYIGESINNIAGRLKRHIDKIYVRIDKRSDFFKLKEHQGDLTLYYYPLPASLLIHRKTIEELLTYALQPEYLTYLLKRKMIDLEHIFKSR